MKKIIAAMLAIAVSAFIAVPVCAAAPQKIKSLHPEFAEKISGAAISGETAPVASLQSLSIHPGSELNIILSGRGPDADLFFDQNGETISAADVTASKMRAAGVTAGVYAETGADLIESVDIAVQNAGTPASKPVLRVAFTPDFDGLEAENFAFSVYIFIGGARQEQSEIVIAGELGSPEIFVDSADISVCAEDSVVVALEDVARIGLQAGCGVTVEASLRQGGRYRVRARASDDPDDMEAMEKRGSLVEVIALEADGFYGGDISGVRIESGQGLSVHDENGVPLGETGAARSLPFSEKYYLILNDTPLDIAEVIHPLS